MSIVISDFAMHVLYVFFQESITGNSRYHSQTVTSVSKVKPANLS